MKIGDARESEPWPVMYCMVSRYTSQDPLEGPGSRDSLVGYQSFVCNVGL